MHTSPEVVSSGLNTLIPANPPYMSCALNPYLLSNDTAMVDLYPLAQWQIYGVFLCENINYV